MAAADETSKKSTAREYYEALLIAIIFVNFARIFVFQAFKIPTGSMEDNLKVGDHIIVNKFIYGPGTTLGGLSGDGGRLFGSNDQYTMNARPLIIERGTVPQYRESLERSRLSPIAKYDSAGTT